MKRTISLWLGLLAFALLPTFAQTPALTGKIHGHVTTPTTMAATNGSVSLSTDGGHTSKYTFPVNSNGDYTGEAAPGTYLIIYRAADTPPDKMVDSIDGIKVVLGQDTLADVDMSRKAFIEALSPEQKKALEEIKKKNTDVMKANEVIKKINADIHTSGQDFHDADSAKAAAAQALGATASKPDLEAKEIEIKQAKYAEVEALMLKDTELRPNESSLWALLGQAQVGMKKYDDAEKSYKKVLELEATAKKPNLSAQGAANSGIGEIYARTGKVPEANAAYDAAAKVNPTQASFYLKNEAVIFSQVGNADAQAAAADEAIKADPTQPLPYYLKGQGLIGKTVEDPQTHKLVSPPGCMEAYQKYLELAPTGQYAKDVKDILTSFNQTIDTSYRAAKPPKKK